jgi:putative nucleotidyltransferase with HDIG domain
VVQRQLGDPAFQPPILPEVAVALFEIAHRPDVNVAEVEAAVKRDPTVVARVVAAASSAALAQRGPARSLREALVRLGLIQVRDIAFQVTVHARVFRVPAYSANMRELLNRAQAAGIVAREICRLLRFESDLAYLCGLLHDVGQAIIVGIVGEHIKTTGGAPPPLVLLEPTLRALHAEVGARVCSHWKLPETIVDAVRHHHQPEQSSHPAAMALVVAVADVLLGHAGLCGEAKRVEPLAEPLFYRLNLTPKQVAELLRFVEELAANRASWSIST